MANADKKSTKRKFLTSLTALIATALSTQIGANSGNLQDKDNNLTVDQEKNIHAIGKTRVMAKDFVLTRANSTDGIFAYHTSHRSHSSHSSHSSHRSHYSSSY